MFEQFYCNCELLEVPLGGYIYGFTRFSGLQSSLGITNGNRSHNKTLELI